MTASSPIIVAGAGIGGLTAALALARRGFRVIVLEAAPQLEEIGAGLQLSPNATHVLLALGLGPALKPLVSAPETLRVMNARSGREIVTMPLGVPAAVRYGAPFWSIHRGDLQRVLHDAVNKSGSIDLRLGVQVERVAQRDAEVIVFGIVGKADVQFEGRALIGADGIRSRVRSGLGHTAMPNISRQTAWRALLPADEVAPALREPATTLWLGPGAHVVHYPVQAGAAVNIVAIIRESRNEHEQPLHGDPSVLRKRAARWAPPLHDLVSGPESWGVWATNDLPPLSQWGVGAATLLGDAAHAMRPFLAQGAAMAIEDAAVLARCLTERPHDVAAALRAYEAERLPRSARVVAEARRTGIRYGWRGPMALARNFALARMGGERLRARYDWIYDWKS